MRFRASSTPAAFIRKKYKGFFFLHRTHLAGGPILSENEEDDKAEEPNPPQMEAASQTVRSLSHRPDCDPEEGNAMLRRIEIG